MNGSVKNSSRGVARNIACGLAGLALAACATSVPPADLPKPPTPAPASEPFSPPEVACVPKDYVWQRRVKDKKGKVTVVAKPRFFIPKKGLAGRFPVESHLLTADEQAESGWPKSKGEGIDEHVRASCAVLKAKYGLTDEDCEDVYKNSWERVWTPAEGGGQIGQGSKGIPPHLEEEMFSFNMRWIPPVPPGTKFLLSHGDRHVIVSGGYEFGPGKKIVAKGAIGGVQPEVEYFLGAKTSSTIRVRSLENIQEMPLGPVVCEALARPETQNPAPKSGE